MPKSKSLVSSTNSMSTYLMFRAEQGIAFPFISPDLVSSANQFAYRQVNLMAVFFDILLLDEEFLVYKSYYTRTERLASLITTTPGEVPPPSIQIPMILLTSRRFSPESFPFVSIHSSPQPRYWK